RPVPTRLSVTARWAGRAIVVTGANRRLRLGLRLRFAALSDVAGKAGERDSVGGGDFVRLQQVGPAVECHDLGVAALAQFSQGGLLVRAVRQARLGPADPLAEPVEQIVEVPVGIVVGPEVGWQQAARA